MMNNNPLDNYTFAINPKHKKHIIARHLPSSDSLFIAKAFQLQASPLLVIANNSYEANRIADELAYFAPNARIAIFPDTEVLPYERVTPQGELIASRLSTLWQMSMRQLDIVVVAGQSIQSRICPVNYLNSRILILKIADKLSISELRKKLLASDYGLVDNVYQAGEFAVRGGIIDIIPMGHNDLIRIELFDNEIESLKIIDVKTKQLIENTDKIEIIPTREYPTDAQSISEFSNNFKHKFPESSNENYIKEIKS
ncbi:MAG: hypothetical protein K2P99_05240, partial [Burkholderiales bacterium]|nr:hypothetical protein [Burkholderiales bacterium]